MRVEGLITNYDAGATVNPRRICKHGSSDTEAVQSSAAADLHIGISDSVGTHLNGVPDSNGVVDAGEPLDIHRTGIAYCDYGGNVTRGQPVTADAAGKAVVATTGQRAIGTAEISGVDGDVGQVFVAPFYVP